MTARPEDIQRRLSGLAEIGQVVGALRAIASGHTNAARDGVAAIRGYQATVAAALARVTPAAVQTPDGPGLALVIGAAQGFSGSYAARIAAAAQQAHADGAALLVLGGRTLSMLPEGVAPVWSDDLPAQLAQVPVLASRVTDALVSLAADHPGPITLVSGRDQPGQPVETRRIWPPPVSGTVSGGPMPLTTLPAADLAAALLNEALFAAVALALTEAFRAENQARFEAMARALSNLRDKRAELQRTYQQARQEQMTTELIELATAAASITS